MKLSEDEFIDATKDRAKWEQLRSRLERSEKSALLAFAVVSFSAIFYLVAEALFFPASTTDSATNISIPIILLILSIVPFSGVFALRLCRLTMAAICETK